MAPQGVDAVFDTSGAGVLPESVDLAGGPDRVITIADMNAAEYEVRFTGMDPADRAPEALPELAALAASGRLTVEIWRTYPLTDAAQAQDDIDHRRNHGKIILLPTVPTHTDLPGIEDLARRFYQAFDTADPDLLDQGRRRSRCR